MADSNMRDVSDLPLVLKLSGYTDLPPGKIASLVTFLEMHSRPQAKPDPAVVTGLRLLRLSAPEADRYLAIFRTLGERWLWSSRLVMPRPELDATLGDPLVEAFALVGPDGDCGLLELDFREAGACELGFFGVFEPLTGTGAARWMMNRALELAWRPGVARMWVHTCHFDHPAALGFYRRSGFRPYRLAIEVEDDPRLSGVMRREAAPHVPLVEPPA
jgi:GNAT superfamily N-acetyltransferase